MSKIIIRLENNLFPSPLKRKENIGTKRSAGTAETCNNKGRHANTISEATLICTK